MNLPPRAVLLARWRALVDEAPGRIAVDMGGLAMSRADLETAIVAQQAALATADVGPCDIVAWLGINTPQMLAMLLACERLGAVFMPLNWRLADDELLAIVRHAGVRTLMGSADMTARMGLLRDAARLDSAFAAGTAQQGDLMLVYTSGTTGRPKGAMHTAVGMAANAEAAIALQRLGEGTRTLTVLPMFHVGGLCIQTLPTLLAGGCVRLHARFDAQACIDDIAQWRPTTTLQVPATMHALVHHAAWRDADLSSLEFINSGSSIVPAAMIEVFHARGVPVAQVYGSTETGPFSIALDPKEARNHVGSVGRPVAGVEIRLVGGDGAEAADGAVGEILVRGPNVMRGYHREPNHPSFRDGWFHSGDLGRRDARGFYEVVGRSSDLIISGGEHIYPAEIENLVAGLGGVAECAVVGVPDAQWGEVPVLAVVPTEGTELHAQALRSAYEPRLARFKHPHRIVIVQALPKTALGKVRKAELAAAMQSAAATQLLS